MTKQRISIAGSDIVGGMRGVLGGVFISTQAILRSGDKLVRVYRWDDGAAEGSVLGEDELDLLVRRGEAALLSTPVPTPGPVEWWRVAADLWKAVTDELPAGALVAIEGDLERGYGLVVSRDAGRDARGEIRDQARLRLLLADEAADRRRWADLLMGAFDTGAPEAFGVQAYIARLEGDTDEAESWLDAAANTGGPAWRSRAEQYRDELDDSRFQSQRHDLRVAFGRMRQLTARIVGWTPRSSGRLVGETMAPVVRRDTLSGSVILSGFEADPKIVGFKADTDIQMSIPSVVPNVALRSPAVAQEET